MRDAFAAVAARNDRIHKAELAVSRRAEIIAKIYARQRPF